MAKTMKTMMMALLAGSVAVGAGGFAYAKSDAAADPAKFQQRIEKRIDKALQGTDVNDVQKKKVTEILQAGFADMKPLRAKAMESRKALQEAMQAPTVDKAKIEAIRAETMKVADDSSKRFTTALTDAGDVLNANQRQAFFKNWSMAGHHGKKHG